MKLVAALRFLAGGLAIDICWGWGLNENSFYAFVWEVCEAIDEVINNIEFPCREKCHTDEEFMHKLFMLEREFAIFSKEYIRGTVAAIDGVVFRMERPDPKEVNGDVKSYFVRKNYYAYGMQAMCDARCRFVSLSSSLCSSSHDASVYKCSNFAEMIRDGKLPNNFHVVMDEAYPCTEYELTPWSGKDLTVEQDAFNFYLSRQRQCIERAFGMLVGRFGIFWRPLKINMSRIPLVISVCAKLHNICVDRFHYQKNIDTFHNNSRDTDHQDGDRFLPIYDDRTGIYRGYRRDLEVSKKRDRITEDVGSKGGRRPPLSKHSRIFRGV